MSGQPVITLVGTMTLYGSTLLDTLLRACLLSFFSVKHLVKYGLLKLPAGLKSGRYTLVLPSHLRGQAAKGAVLTPRFQGHNTEGVGHHLLCRLV